jgi:hypothetical protein
VGPLFVADVAGTAQTPAMYSIAIKQLAVNKVLVQGKSVAQACRELRGPEGNPCGRTVFRWLSRYGAHGHLQRKLRLPKFSKDWTPGELRTLLEFIDGNGEAVTHDTLKMVCSGWFGIDLVVGGQTSRLLKKLNVTRKRVLFISPLQDLIKVFDYKQHLIAQGYTVDQLVANDESYVNKGTLNFCFCYSRRGRRCRAKSGTAYTQRRAILASISTAGLVGQAGIYHKGSTNEDVFLHSRVPRASAPTPRSRFPPSRRRTGRQTDRRR